LLIEIEIITKFLTLCKIIYMQMDDFKVEYL